MKHKKLVISLSVVGSLLLTLVVLFFTTNIIQFCLIRIVCSDKPSSIPDNYEEILESTKLSTFKYSDKSDDNYLDVIEPVDYVDEQVTLIYFHGGYYVGGGRHSMEPFCRYIASLGYRVINADYRLAYENIWPSQLIDGLDVVNYVNQNYPSEYGYVISGDSAGCHMAAMICSYSTSSTLQDKYKIEVNNVVGMVGNCGFYEASTIKETNFFMASNAISMLLGDLSYRKNEAVKELDLKYYVDNFVPSLIICGDKDPFITQNKQFYDLLVDSNRNVSCYFPESKDNDLAHEFQCNFNYEECFVALDKIDEFLKGFKKLG